MTETMKLQIQLQDPDGFYECVNSAVKSEVKKIHGLSESEKESMIEDRMETLFDTLSAWVEFQERITIEFDTEAKTATVLPQ